MTRLAVIFALTAAAFALPATAASIYNNLTPTNGIGVASRPGFGNAIEIETADDFLLTTPAVINQASFVGLIVGLPGGGTPSVLDVNVEIYRVFPKDSDTGRLPQVPTRANSPSDVAFDERDSTASQSTFSTSVLSNSFSALNSIAPGGIHPQPNVTTGGNGPITGQEVQFDVNFTTPFLLDPDHYFFVAQVLLSDGGQFYWLSASRPISGAGTTPFAPDLQAWTRDAILNPDWLRVGTDIVGGGVNAPTFNLAFSLDGTVVPEPGSAMLFLTGLGLLAAARRFCR